MGSELSRILLKLLNLFLMAIFVLVAATLFRDYQKNFNPLAVPGSVNLRSKTFKGIEFQTTLQPEKIRRISQHPLFSFKNHQKEDSRPQPVVKSSPLKAGFRLIGTIVTGSAQKKGLAIVQKGQNRHQQLVAVGDTIGKYQVTAVMPNRISLSYKDKAYLLTIGDDGQSGKTTAPATETRQGQPPKAVTDIALNRVSVVKAMGNIEDAVSQIEVVPAYRNGTIQGLEIQAVNNSSIFSQMRLKTGDVISHINGFPIKSSADVAQIYTKAKTASKIQIVLWRNDRHFTFNYGLK